MNKVFIVSILELVSFTLSQLKMFYVLVGTFLTAFQFKRKRSMSVL